MSKYNLIKNIIYIYIYIYIYTLPSHFIRYTRGVQLGLDQSSSSTLTESSFLFDSCLIHRDTVMLE